MKTPVAGAIAILLLAPGTAAAQGAAPPPGGRILVVSQRSYWLPEGWDSSRVSAAETLITVAGEGTLDPSAATSAIRIGLGAYPRFHARIQRDRRGRFRAAKLIQPERPNLFGYPDPNDLRELGSAVADLGGWLSVPALDVPVDTIRSVIVIDADTLRVRRERRWSQRADGEGDGHLAATTAVTIEGASRVEEHLTPGGVTVRVALSGLASERFRYAAADGRLDSIVETGRLTGLLRYLHPDGTADTTQGTWVYTRTAAWRPDPAEERRRQSEYFYQHGRYPEGPAPDEVRSSADSAFAVVNESEPDADSLWSAWAHTPSPFQRMGLEAVLGRVHAFGGAPIEGHPEITHGRQGTPFAATLLAARGSRRDRPLSRARAEALADVLMSERYQRNGALNREDLFAETVGLLSDVQRVDAAAAPQLLADARRADQSLGRDLILLMAYMSDPAAARPLVEELADRTEGYGPIVRAYLEARTSLLLASWGLRRGDRIFRRDTFPFPGIQADVSAQRRFLAQGAGGARVFPAIALWFEARGQDPRAAFGERFRTPAPPGDRLVWARYLVELGDSTPASWLRDTLAVRRDSLRDEAIYLLSAWPDTVTDKAVLREIQDGMLRWAMGDGGFRDTTGHLPERFQPHDERAGDWFLISDHLIENVSAPWRGRLTPITADSLQARAQREGLQMALVIGPVLRIADRYRVSVALAPFDRQRFGCLCGGGADFTLERRDGRWVVVSLSQWVS